MRREPKLLLPKNVATIDERLYLDSLAEDASNFLRMAVDRMKHP